MFVTRYVKYVFRLGDVLCRQEIVAGLLSSNFQRKSSKSTEGRVGLYRPEIGRK